SATILLTAQLAELRHQIKDAITTYTTALELGGSSGAIAEINYSLTRLYRTLANETNDRDERKRLLERAEYYSKAGSGLISN
ncbi:hypothetical protein K8R78_04910, partial [bacterium]|nr:hypothetical protein [bacterium]